MSMKDYPEEIVSIVRKINSADDLQNFFETLGGKPMADNFPYDMFYSKIIEGSRQKDRPASTSMTGLAVRPAISYLDASYATIADSVKDKGVYGKAIAVNLLLDSKAMLRAADDMNDIQAAFKYAFHAGSVIAEAVWQLDGIAADFRAGDKKFPDIFALVRIIEGAPWQVQKVFLEAEQNADIADLVRQAHTREFARQIFENRVAAGDELFKKAGLADKAEELQTVMQELAQAEEEYIKAHARFSAFVMIKDTEVMRTKRITVSRGGNFDVAEHNLRMANQIAVSREMKTKIAELEKRKEDIFLEIKKKMVKYSSVSHKDAVKWMKNNVTFEKSVNKMILSRWFNIVGSSSNENDITLDTAKEELANIYRNTNVIIDRIKSELEYIYRITNGQIDHIKINVADLYMSHDRAMACTEGNTISLPKADFGALYHEAGHIFEFANPCFLSPSIYFVKERATGAMQKLAELTKKEDFDDDESYSDCDDDESYSDYGDDESYSDYGDDEMAFPGRFSHPYVGKLYAGATEVLATGLDIFADAERFVRGIEDMEHLKFCFGCFFSRPLNGIELNDEDGLIKKAGDVAKTATWIEALDNAMPDSFATDLFSRDGVKELRIVEKVSVPTGIPFWSDEVRKLRTAKVLKYWGDVIAQKNDSDDAIKKLARIAYLAKCNLNELIPDACPIINGYYLDKLSCNPPKWYTPLTELPRL